MSSITRGRRLPAIRSGRRRRPTTSRPPASRALLRMRSSPDQRRRRPRPRRLRQGRESGETGDDRDKASGAAVATMEAVKPEVADPPPPVPPKIDPPGPQPAADKADMPLAPDPPVPLPVPVSEKTFVDVPIPRPRPEFQARPVKATRAAAITTAAGSGYADGDLHRPGRRRLLRSRPDPGHRPGRPARRDQGAAVPVRPPDVDPHQPAGPADAARRSDPRAKRQRRHHLRRHADQPGLHPVPRRRVAARRRHSRCARPDPDGHADHGRRRRRGRRRHPRHGLRLFRGRRPALQHLPAGQRDRGDQSRRALPRRTTATRCARFWRSPSRRNARPDGYLRHPARRTARSIRPAS